MSYILDALRRADSERERGAVPGLHAQSMRADAADLRTKPWWGQPWAWVGAGLCGGLLVAGLARWLFADPAPSSAAVVVSDSLTMPTQTPTPVTPPAPVVTPVAPSPPPVPRPAVPPPAVTAAPPAPPIYNAPPIESRKPVAAVNPTPAAAAASTPAAQADTRTYALNELPDEVRRQLPNLSIGGSSYAENPANRLLILNGQVFREGDKITAELALEQIQLKSAVLRFKGYRYRVSY